VLPKAHCFTSDGEEEEAKGEDASGEEVMVDGGFVASAASGVALVVMVVEDALGTGVADDGFFCCFF